MLNFEHLNLVEGDDSSLSAFCLDVWISPLILHTACTFVSGVNVLSSNVQSRKVCSSDFSLKEFIPGKTDEITTDLTPAFPCSPQSQESQQTSPHSLTVCDLSPCNTFAGQVMKILYCSKLGTFNSNKQTNKEIKGF